MRVCARVCVHVQGQAGSWDPRGLDLLLLPVPGQEQRHMRGRCTARLSFRPELVGDATLWSGPDLQHGKHAFRLEIRYNLMGPLMMEGPKVKMRVPVTMQFSKCLWQMLGSAPQRLGPHRSPAISTAFSPPRDGEEGEGAHMHPPPRFPLDMCSGGSPSLPPGAPAHALCCPRRSVPPASPRPPGPSSGQPGSAMNSTRPFPFQI